MSPADDLSPLRGKSLAVYLPDLSGGGAERLHVNLAPFFLDLGLKLTFVLDRAQGPLLASLPREVEVVSLGCDRVLQSLPRLVRYLRARRPDFLLANLGHNNVVALWARALARGPTQVFVTQHNQLSAEARKGGSYRFLPPLYRLFLPFARGIVAVSAGIADDMCRITGLSPGRVTVIYNGVVTRDFDARLAQPAVCPWLGDGGPPVFVGIGRLVAQKDFPTLLSALSLVRKERAARLVILGEGPERPALEALADRLGLVDAVALPGFTENPLPVLRDAAAVVLASRHEGFAIVLAEALACGTPVVSTDCPHGPAEILENGRFGRLVPVGDAEAMAQAMIATLDDPPPRQDLVARGREFSVARCARQYADLLLGRPGAQGPFGPARPRREPA